MATANSIKASEKQAIAKKLVTALKKRHGSSVPKVELPVLESLIYAACLEDETYERAQEYYDRLLATFHDLNEIRVSSIWEVEAAFEGMSDPDWRSLRVRSALQYVFEKNYVFDFEVLRKKTQDLAARHLGKIPNQSPFICNFVMQNTLGAHLVPLDKSMLNLAIYLGLLERKATENDGADSLKAAIRKADVPLFVALFKAFSLEPHVQEILTDELSLTEDEFDPTEAPDRLNELIELVDNSRKRASYKKKVKARITAEKKEAAKQKAAETRKRKAEEKKKKEAEKKKVEKAAETKKKAKKKTAATSKTPARKK